MRGSMDCYNECRKFHNAMYCLVECTRKDPAPAPTSMRTLIYRATGCPYAHIHVRDARLDPISRVDLNVFLEQDKTDLMRYIKESRDCDDYALRLQWMARDYFFKKGINVAFCMIEAPISTDMHRLNGVALKGNIFNVIEPQTDGVFPVGDYLIGPPTLVDM